MNFPLRSIFALGLLLGFGQLGTADFYQSASQSQHFPERSQTSLSGSEFIALTDGFSMDQRERAILSELEEGNIPDFLRDLTAVHMTHTGRDGKKYRATIWVTPDYLSIGSDQDYIRMPMNPLTAQKIADQFDFVLPTRKLVDEIYRNSVVKLQPSPMQPTSKMTSNDYYQNHDRKINRQSQGRGFSGKLVSGHKKDVVITKRLNQLPDRVAIYGWHRSNGRPIQPLSLVHGNYYADYSHGVRLIRNVMVVNGVEMSVEDVLKDPVLSDIISDEGALATGRYL